MHAVVADSEGRLEVVGVVEEVVDVVCAVVPYFKAIAMTSVVMSLFPTCLFLRDPNGFGLFGAWDNSDRCEPIRMRDNLKNIW